MRKDSSSAQPCIDVRSMPSITKAEAGIYEVELVSAHDERFNKFGRKVYDYDNEVVVIETWPQPGWRPVESGTGNEGGITEGEFVFKRQGGLMTAFNHAVDGHYVSGWFSDPATAHAEQRGCDYSRVLVREANYHPDGGQVFYPQNHTPFVALLALPGDDIKPEDFVAFYCDGSFGIQIWPSIWHQPIFPLADEARYDDKQGKVHACIACDFIAEFGVYLSVPLRATE